LGICFCEPKPGHRLDAEQLWGDSRTESFPDRGRWQPLSGLRHHIRDAGTTALNTGLLGRLARKTTYFDRFTHSNSTVFKIPKTLLTSFVDDIVIAEEVANELVMVHWDGARFLTRRLVVSGAVSLEHITFAPIEAQA